MTEPRALDAGDVIRELNLQGQYIQSFPLGLHLGIPTKELRVIEYHYKDQGPLSLLAEVLAYWIKNRKEETGIWFELAHALKNIGLVSFAKRIATVHNDRNPSGTQIDLKDMEVDLDDANVAEITTNDRLLMENRIQLIELTEKIDATGDHIKTLRQEMEKNDSSVKQLQEEKEKYAKELEGKQQQRKELSDSLPETSTHKGAILEDYDKRLAGLKADIANCEEEIVAKEATQAQTQEKLASREKELAELEKQKEQKQVKSEVLLQRLQQSTEKFEELVKNNVEANEKITESARKLQKAIEDIDEQVKKLDSQRQELENFRMEMVAQQTQIFKQLASNSPASHVNTGSVENILDKYEGTRNESIEPKPQGPYPYWCKHWLFHKGVICESCKEKLEAERKKHEPQENIFE